MANVVELLKNKFDLLCKLAGGWCGSKFDGFDEGALELLVKLVGCLDLENVVSKRYQIGYSLHLQLLSAL